jgi:TorA maturation chaperone TorD
MLAKMADSEARARAKICSFLAEVFRTRPTEETVGTIRAMAAELGVDCPGDVSLSELDDEFRVLFVIPNPRYVAPYESVFRDEWPLPAVLRRGSNPSETGQKIKGLLMGESTLQVRNAYIRVGVCPDRDLPDHISNELSFVAYLSGKEAEAVNGEGEALVEARKEFLCDHLFAWIGMLRERLRARDRFGVYRAAIEVAEVVLREGDIEAVLQESSEPAHSALPLASATSQFSGCPFHCADQKGTLC